MSLVTGMYSGLKYQFQYLDSAGVAGVDFVLETLVAGNKEDAVVSVFVIPSWATGYVTGRDSALPTTPVTADEYITRPSIIDSVYGAPRNKKLLTYPYTFLAVDTLNEVKEYRFEWSNTNDGITFNFQSCVSPNPEIVIAPKNYNGGSSVNPTESVTISGYPQCAYTIDAYRAWLAQKASGELIGLAGSAVGTLASVASGNVVGGVLSVMGMASTINSITKEATQGSRARGQQGSSTLTALKEKTAYFKIMGVNREYASMIDSFFDRYGYACCKVKTPNRAVRPYWTYTKTRDCALTGNAPSDALAKIKTIYDKGITFWTNIANVGNYSLDNRPN